MIRYRLNCKIRGLVMRLYSVCIANTVSIVKQHCSVVTVEHGDIACTYAMVELFILSFTMYKANTVTYKLVAGYNLHTTFWTFIFKLYIAFIFDYRECVISVSV